MPTRVRLLVAAGLLLIAGAAGQAGPAPTPTAAPGARIDSLTHTARGVLRAGDRITVTLRGSAGGAATFHIFGVVTDVGMREIRTGVYQAQPALYIGTYIVRPGDGARNAAVSATLAVRGSDVMAFGQRAVTIDTTPPLLTCLHPRPEATLANTRPNIVVCLFDRESAVNRGAVRLVVNGQDVTTRAPITEGAVSYAPDAPFAPGPVRVRVVVADRAKNTARAEWTFRVAAGALIHSVTISPTTPLRSGDLLTVVMTGLPGGRAAFAIQGLPGTIPMRERGQGVYLGSYAAAPGRSLVDAPVLVTLEKEGRRSTTAASAGVSVLPAPPPAPTIASPGRAIVLGQEVVARLILRGRALPGTRIAGRIVYAGRSPEEQGVLGEFAAVTAGDGAWQAALGPYILPEGARLVMTVVAVDPAGQRSLPASLTVNP